MNPDILGLDHEKREYIRESTMRLKGTSLPGDLGALH